MMGGPARFYADLVAAAAAGRPWVWRRPAGAPTFTADELFEWLCAAADDDAFARREVRLRLHIGRRPLPSAAAHLPRADDRSIGGWLARLDADYGPECGLVVNDLQAASPAAWTAARRILADVYEGFGLAPGGSSLELFSGAYRRGFLGVHKDNQDVVTFVVEGRKRFHLWPFGRFAEHPGVAADAALRSHDLPDVDVDAHLDGAVTLEGGPGDVFFWPAAWWHVAASDGERCTTLGLGVFRDATAWRFADAAIESILTDDPELAAQHLSLPAPGEFAGDGSALLDASRARIDAAMNHRDLHRRVDEAVLGFATAYGCNRVAAPRRDPLPRSTPLRLAAPGSVLWARRGGALLWSVGGECHRYPDVPPLAALLAKVAGGERFTVDRLIAEFDDGTIEREALLHVLGILYARHGVVVETGP